MPDSQRPAIVEDYVKSLLEIQKNLITERCLFLLSARGLGQGKEEGRQARHLSARGGPWRAGTAELPSPTCELPSLSVPVRPRGSSVPAELRGAGLGASRFTPSTLPVSVSANGVRFAHWPVLRPASPASPRPCPLSGPVSSRRFRPPPAPPPRPRRSHGFHAPSRRPPSTQS